MDPVSTKHYSEIQGDGKTREKLNICYHAQAKLKLVVLFCFVARKINLAKRLSADMVVGYVFCSFLHGLFLLLQNECFSICCRAVLLNL